MKVTYLRSKVVFKLCLTSFLTQSKPLPIMDVKIKAVLYTSKTFKDGTHPIMIRITQNRKLLYKSVGHSVPKDAWDIDTNRVYDKKPTISKRQEGQYTVEKLTELKERYRHAIVLHNAGTINSDIEGKLNEVAGINQKLKINDEAVNLKVIKTKLSRQDQGDRDKSLLVFGAEYRDNFLKIGSIGTYKSYKSSLNKLQAFIGKKDLFFSDLTVQFLQDYNSYLLNKGKKVEGEQSKMKVNSVHKHLKAIRAIYYEAISQQMIPGEKNPFLVFKLKLDKDVMKAKLTVEEIVAIEKLELGADSLMNHVRNFFLFSFYCAGVRASDVLQLKWENVNVEGRLEYRMDKTGHRKSISLIPKAMAILSQYKTLNHSADTFVFPFIDATLELSDSMVLFNQISSCTALINKYLKEVAKAAKIDKVLSTHIARHSFADIARTRKASIYDISKMLGHSSIKVTEAYLATLDIDSQDETMKSILDF